MEAVGAGQVEHAQVLAGRGDELAFLALDRHAGVVGDLLVAAGEPVEERGLAAVGVAYQREQRPAAVHVDDGLLHAVASPAMPCSVDTCTQAASTRRSANVDEPTRTTSGSPPGKARVITITRSPGRKPISSSQSCHSGASAGGATCVTVQAWRSGSWSRVRVMSWL